MATKRLQQRSGEKHGFTLIEAMFAIMIIGIGIAALMTVFAAGTNVNAYGDRLSKSVFLADEIRAMTDNIGFGADGKATQLLALHGRTFNGVDANGAVVAGLQDYQQTILVRMVYPENMTTYAGTDPPGLVITAAVSFNNEELTRLSWIRTP
jgi:prepilin-type N-terminal cleavage/methylation domain-containing protein